MLKCLTRLFAFTLILFSSAAHAVLYCSKTPANPNGFPTIEAACQDMFNQRTAMNDANWLKWEIDSYTLNTNYPTLYGQGGCKLTGNLPGYGPDHRFNITFLMSCT